MLCFIGVGSNVGNRFRNIRRAAEMLKDTPGFRDMRISPLYETRPAGGPAPQRDYLNAVVRVHTTLEARALLESLKRIEKALGRKPSRVRWAARPIDLDILFFGKKVIRRRGLTVPHPLLDQRSFVLRPMADLAPRWRHPVTGRTVAQMLKAL